MRPFSPIGDTTNIAVTATAQDMTLPSEARGDSLMLTNIGTQTVFVDFVGTATAATGVPILAGSQVVFGNTRKTTASVIAGAAGSTLYATRGDGV